MAPKAAAMIAPAIGAAAYPISNRITSSVPIDGYVGRQRLGNPTLVPGLYQCVNRSTQFTQARFSERDVTRKCTQEADVFICRIEQVTIQFELIDEIQGVFFRLTSVGIGEWRKHVRRQLRIDLADFREESPQILGMTVSEHRQVPAMPEKMR